MLDSKLTGVIEGCLPTYEIIGELGQGIHGSVFHVKDSLKERAVKVVPIHVERSTLFREDTDLDSKVSRDFHAVCRYYEKVKGPDVVTVHDFHLVNKRISSGYAEAFLVILMEKCVGNLQDRVLKEHPMAPASVHGCSIDLATMMNRLAKASGEVFLLTDFKPSNILVGAEGQLLMGDLGGLKRVSSVSSTVGGAQFTPNWSAPEILLQGEKPDVVSGVYSLGLVIFYLCEGRLPHEESDFIDRVRLVKTEGADFMRDDLPEHVVSTINKCLCFDRSKRLQSFQAVEESLSHEPEALKVAQRPAVVESISQEKKTVQQTEVEHLPRPQAEGYTGMQLAWIPGEVFTVEGSTEEVTGFYMGCTPVTQYQWRRVMGTNPSHFPKSSDHPVEMVAWSEAVSFCQKLTDICHRKQVFFIPTEAEWLLAARGGLHGTLYAGGNDLNALGWHLTNSSFTTHSVGEKDPNGFGVYDMCGNVQEWCDGSLGCHGTPVPGGRDRVVRGGSWNQTPLKCSLNSRRVVAGGLRYSNLGFRVAMRLAETFG